MAVIKVPKTPRRAFDTGRTPSKLLKDQVKHLEWAVRPASQRKPGDFRPRPPRTEGQAAARIATLTRRLLEQKTQASQATVPAIPPPAAAAPAAAAARATKPGRGRRAGSGGAPRPKPRTRKRR